MLQSNRKCANKMFASNNPIFERGVGAWMLLSRDSSAEDPYTSLTPSLQQSTCSRCLPLPAQLELNHFQANIRSRGCVVGVWLFPTLVSTEIEVNVQEIAAASRSSPK